MTGRPEPQSDHRTIGSWKRTGNAAFLIWVTRRAEQPAPRGPLQRAGLAAVVAAVAVIAGFDPTSLHGPP